MQYINSDNTKPTFTSEGLMNKKDMVPYKLQISSGTQQLSVLWAVRIGSLEIRKVIQLDYAKLYITTTVVVKNVATTPITEFVCK